MNRYFLKFFLVFPSGVVLSWVVSVTFFWSLPHLFLYSFYFVFTFYELCISCWMEHFPCLIFVTMVFFSSIGTQQLLNVITETVVKGLFDICSLNDDLRSSFNELDSSLSPPSFVTRPHFAFFGHRNSPTLVISRYKFRVVVFSIRLVKNTSFGFSGLQKINK